jgi:hypothetical protein
MIRPLLAIAILSLSFGTVKAEWPHEL